MSKLLQELSDVSNIANITEVKFGLLNPEALKKASVCHVTIPETYDGNEPKENGLFDPRMGVLERGRICPTDDYDHTICPGYFGHIELPLPVYWIQHMDTIIKLLRCVCIRCANLLIDKSNPIIMKELKKKNGANAFKYVADLCTKQSSKKCVYNGGCNAVQPTIYRKVMGDKYKNDNIIQIDAEYSSDAFKDANEKKLKFMLPVEHVLNIFKKITNEDAELLGFDIVDSRPEWMICTVVPVAPPAVRPSVRQDNNQRAEDDLTSKIAEIVKNVNLLKKELEKALKKDSDVEKESSARQINLVHNMIQYHVATMVDNEIKNIPVSSRRSGQPLKMIRQRLKGKEGRIRSNIMGKRVDFSGRTVVGVDPSISIDEYGVPMKIAMNLTVPEIVTKYNKDKLYRLVRNGPLVHPGAKQITKMNYDENGIAHPEHIYLKYIDRNSVVLEDGDVIDRHLMDGDWGQFNRQPSLHRMSMMAHKVKVMPGKTFRLNVYCTAPYNADFDGDEMNTHIPQNIQTAYELEKLTAVPTQIISPAKSEPIIQVNFDTMVAAYLITHPHIKISKKNMFNLTMTNPQFTGKMPSPDKDGNWRGQDIFTMFLPDISFTKENKSYDMDPVDHNKVIIENGVFKQGILDKTIIGKTLIHMIFDSFGPEAVRNFLDNNQRMLNRWLSEHCFTLGMGDCIPTSEDNKKIREIIEGKIQNVNTIIKEANVGIYKPDLDAKFIHISLEEDIKEQLDGSKYDFEKYLKKTIDRKNGMYITNSSGAKGDVLSAICQTRGFLGQTSIINKRVAFGYDKRTLPHFSKDDYGAISRGFIVNNFFNGLDPHELFFHQMGGRVGVIDTAIKTAESGYMQRRLIKALEDLSVKYGGTVRNGVNNIVQFAYGDDGIDPCKLNKQELKLIEYSNEEMAKKYLITEESMTLLKNIMTADSYKEMTSQKDYINNLRTDYELIMEIRDTARKSYFKNMSVMNAVVFSPVFFPRTIKNARDMFKNQLGKKSDLTPTYIRAQLKELEAELSRYLPKFSLNIFRALLYSNLSTKVSMIENKFNKVVFKFVIDTIREKYITSFVQPGEMVGIIGAQSMGEPLTQMSVPAETRIVVQLNGRMMNTTIGEFVDKTIKGKNGEIFVDNTGHHTIMEVRDNMRILSVSPDEKIAWREISKVSRHPVNGKMMVVKTRTGRSTKATLSHSFLKRTINGIVPIEGSKLAVGDRIPVCMNLPAVDNAIEALSILGMKIEFDKLFGIFCAVSSYNFRPTKQGYVVNVYGNEVDRHMIYFLEKNGIAYEKRESIMIVKSLEMAVFISETFVKNFSCIYQMPLEFIRGYLEGIIHFYGVVQMSRKQVVIMMDCARLVDIQNLLNYFGVFCHFEEGEIVIVRKYVPKFAKEFDILGYEKQAQVKFILDTQRDTQKCIDYVDKIPAVGNLISDIGKRLNLSGNSRVYGRWKESESIGRNTLKKYLSDFHGAMGRVDDYELKLKVELVEQAVNSDVIWDEIISIDYYEGDELEYVYDFTVPNAESFMVDNGIMVHNTLNSVSWDTEIMLKVDDKFVRTKIGAWIDGRIESAEEHNVEKHPNDTTLEYIRDKKVYVPACTEDGRIIWDEVEATTRHPVVNKDGTNTVLKITTESGRVVVATKAKSFLKRVNNKIIGVDGDILKVGDYLPVSNSIVFEDYDDKWLCGKLDYRIPCVETVEFGTINIHRKKVEKYILKSKNDTDKKVFESLLNEQIVYDKIVRIDEIVSEYPYMYDLTVKNTRNFNIYNGLCMRDTFHNAGVGAKALVTSTGVPRIKEIINVSKTIKSPSMEIYLKDEYAEDITGAKYVCNYIGFTKLQDIVERTMIIYENRSDETSIEEDVEYIRTYQEFADAIGIPVCPTDQTSNWILRVVFNKEKMMNKNIYLSDIQDVIQRNSVEDDIVCIFSDDNAKELMMRIRIREDSHDGDYLEFLQELEKILMGITIRGIPNVEQVQPIMRKKIVYRDDGSYNQTTEWYLQTIGVNLLDVLMNDKIDSTRTLSNDIHEINEIFGIEATRAIIIRELMKMQDYEVNYRHLSLLGDIMTHRGIIMPIERHGINRSGERGAIAKATFEESTEILVKASTFAEKDKMGGVSANVMFGQLPRVGTNSFDILFDEVKFFNELKKMKTEGKKYEEKVDIVDKIEDKLLKEYDENLGESVDDMFNFSVDATKLTEKPMKPHIIPETGLNNAVVADSKKKKIPMKKKE
jgi:DNA-directed RNA polymerase beta' subunit